MRHINIPVFIPHLGCPNQCVFCNQRTISGVSGFKIENVRYTIENAISTIGENCQVEIAFFGGSFTGIDRDLMIDLLEIGKEYIDKGLVTSIRCSTRPDYIDDEILIILKKYGVRTIELGLQSSSDKVLKISKRGHSLSDESLACKKIIEHGFDLVGQMMIGLPASSPDDEIKTAEFIIASGAKAARIYPTVVFRDTELCALTENGEYSPLTVEEAVIRTAAVYKKFVEADIDVIRIGLCASENLASDETYYAGPNHSAIGELVENQLYLEKIQEKLEKIQLRDNESIIVYIAKGCLSKAIGQRKKNKFLLMATYNLRDIKFRESMELSGYEVSVEVERKK